MPAGLLCDDPEIAIWLEYLDTDQAIAPLRHLVDELSPIEIDRDFPEHLVHRAVEPAEGLCRWKTIVRSKNGYLPGCAREDGDWR